MTPETENAVWIRSSFSGGTNGDCVEVAFLQDGAAIRDSKEGDKGPMIRVGRQALQGLVMGLKFR
jgi:hypothetical protein